MGFILKELDGFTQLTLITLDGLQSFRVGLIGMIQANFKLIDFSLKLLLNTKSLSLCTLLSFNRCSKRIHGTGMIFPGVVKLFFLLSNTPVNFLSHLCKFKLGTENLVFLHLQSCLGFFQCSLELFFFLLQSAALFIQIMNRAATLSKLIKEILDFISQIFIFTLDNVKLFNSLLLGSPQTEKLRAVVAALILRGCHLSSNIRSLRLPFTKDLVKVLCTLFSNKSCGMNSFIFHGDIIKVRSKSALRFFSIGNLG